MTGSTAATLCGQLVLIGGSQVGWPPVNFIHQLVEGQWVEIGSMYRLDAEVEETTLFREPRALGCRRPERQRGRY